MGMPTPLSRVTFDFDSVPANHHSDYPFKKNKLYIFLGEIVGMEGHCVVVEQSSGQIYAGYHSDNFIEFEED